MKKILFYSLCFLVVFSCKRDGQYTDHLQIVPQDTLKYWLSNNQWPVPETVIIYDSIGNEIDQDSFYVLQESKDITWDYFFNQEHVVERIILRKATKKDKIFFTEMDEIESLSSVNSTFQNLKNVPVDCKDKRRLLEQVYKSDQANRANGFEGIDKAIDVFNMEIVHSLIDKCGSELLNDLSPKHGSAMFLVIQHSDHNWRLNYSDFLESMVPQNLIKPSQIALLRDRILMGNNEPQLYGTQIKNGVLYKVDNMDSVKVRRQEMGMITLEEYLEELKEYLD